MGKIWHGLMRVLEVRHLDRYGRLLWERRNILNMLHNDGEEFLLRAAFTGGQTSTVIPENYYVGLDNRTTIAADDTMDSIVGEPSLGGYDRATVASSGDFTINFTSGHFTAVSPLIAFSSTSADWGPVANVFLSDQDDDTGYLISTAVLASPFTVEIGQTVTLRLSLELRDCT